MGNGKSKETKEPKSKLVSLYSHYKFWEDLLIKEGIGDKFFTLIGLCDEPLTWHMIDGKIYENPTKEEVKRANAIINETSGYIVAEDGKMFHFWLSFDKDNNEIRLGRPEGINVFKEISKEEIQREESHNDYYASYQIAMRELGKDIRFKEIMARLLKEQGIEGPFAYMRGSVPHGGLQKSPEGQWLDQSIIFFSDKVLEVQLLWNKEKNDYELQILNKFTPETWRARKGGIYLEHFLTVRDRVLEREIKEWEEKEKM